MNIFAIRFASFVDIYVYFMREAQRISIIVSWPGGDVVFTKKVAKKARKLGLWLILKTSQVLQSVILYRLL